MIPPQWQHLLQEMITRKLVESPTFNRSVVGTANFFGGIREGFKAGLAEDPEEYRRQADSDNAEHRSQQHQKQSTERHSSNPDPLAEYLERTKREMEENQRDR